MDECKPLMLGRRVRNIEQVVVRLEHGLTAMFDKLNARLDMLDTRVDKVLTIHGRPGSAAASKGAVATDRPPSGKLKGAHTLAEWDNRKTKVGRYRLTL